MDIEYYNNSHRIPHGKVVSLGAYHGIRVFHVIRAVVRTLQPWGTTIPCMVLFNPPYFALFSQDVPLEAHSWYITRKTLHGGTEQSMHDRRVVPRTNHGARHYVSHRIQTEPPFLSAVSFLTKQMKNELLIARNSRNCDPREAENISGTPPRVVTLIPTRFGSIFSLYGAKII